MRLLAALCALLLTTFQTAAGTYNISDCGPVGQGDDTQAWQTCINLIRNSPRGGEIVTEARIYYVGALDATNLTGLRIRWHENTRVDPIHMATPAPVFDFAGSSNISSIGAGEIFASGPRPVYPTYAMRFIGEDKVHIDGLRTPGKFTSAALGFYGVHSITVQRLQISNFDTVGPALWISDLPGRNSSDFVSYNSEYHQGGGGQHTIWLQDSDHITFRDGIIDNSVYGHIKVIGNVRNVSLESNKFYSELGSPATVVLDAVLPSTATFVRIINPFRDGIPQLYTPTSWGGGVNESTLRIEAP